MLSHLNRAFVRCSKRVPGLHENSLMSAFSVCNQKSPSVDNVSGPRGSRFPYQYEFFG